jgi:hypothetical protein
LVCFDQVTERFARCGIEDNRTRRYRDYEIPAGAPGLVLSTTVAAILSFVFLLVLEIREGVEGWFNFEDDIAASPAVAAIRSAEWHVFLAPEMDNPSTAPARGYQDGDFVDEHGAPIRLYQPHHQA